MLLLPDILSKENAEAIKEVAKTTGIGVESCTRLFSYMADISGDAPKDFIGLVVGDWLHHRRIRSLAKKFQRTNEILEKRGVLGKTEPVSPSIAIPLLQAAQDETREELSELWSRLLANAMDPSRSSVVRQSIIPTLKSFDPLDAFVLEKAFTFNKTDYMRFDRFFESFTEHNLSKDDLIVSILNLVKMDCVERGISTSGKTTNVFRLTPFGRELLRACSL